MGNAVIRTVVDPDTGETIDLMGVVRHGKVRFQRLRPPPDTPRALENMAVFGETATKAYGMRKTGPLPPAAERIQVERPSIRLESPSDSRLAAARVRKQRFYAELLGAAVPEMESELLLRQALRVPFLYVSPTARAELLEQKERQLRERLTRVRAPYLR
ncbi:MAG TPA: hypothetical protein VMG14_03890 [Thermoplasmata archaeon]|nr:hypothetical protein [Thermoplasmata archaeon]HTW76888.1 hypothetical protein [Thermoplasmata archaeon]